MKKLLISDFDGTLYFDGFISKDDVKSILDFQKENVFVIATGSSYTSFKRKCEDSNLSYDYVIVNHGSTILKNDEILLNVSIDKTILNEIIERYDLTNRNNYTLIKDCHDSFFSTAKEGLVTPDTNNITKIHLEFTKENYDKEVNYLKETYKDKLNIYELLYNNDIEIVSKDASKLIAIKKIIEKENISITNVYCIGDGYSDLEMIKKYKGFAIKNAVDKVKENAQKEVNNISELINLINKEQI